MKIICLESREKFKVRIYTEGKYRRYIEVMYDPLNHGQIESAYLMLYRIVRFCLKFFLNTIQINVINGNVGTCIYCQQIKMK